MIKSLHDLEVFKLSFAFSMNLFKASRKFPKEERYSLTDQIIRSSRSITANISEGWGKRVYPNEFKRHLIYALGSLEETKTWLQFAKECVYLDIKEYDYFCLQLDELGAKIYKLFENWKAF